MMPDDATGCIRLDTAHAAWQADLTVTERVGPATVMAVLRALSAMARSSRRHEADVGSALQGAGLTLDPDERDAALEQLVEAECIERIIPLTDGGILLAVTAAGMSRASSGG